jgi:hypothetical protein
MGALMRAKDWTSTPLGPPQTWPQSLRTAISILLNSRHPMFLAWGPQLVFLYNDGYAPIFGAKHPAALGGPFAQVWSEIWSDIKPLVDRALGGEPTWSEAIVRCGSEADIAIKRYGARCHEGKSSPAPAYPWIIGPNAKSRR